MTPAPPPEKWSTRARRIPPSGGPRSSSCSHAASFVVHRAPGFSPSATASASYGSPTSAGRAKVSPAGSNRKYGPIARNGAPSGTSAPSIVSVTSALKAPAGTVRYPPPAHVSVPPEGPTTRLDPLAEPVSAVTAPASDVSGPVPDGEPQPQSATSPTRVMEA